MIDTCMIWQNNEIFLLILSDKPQILLHLEFDLLKLIEYSKWLLHHQVTAQMYLSLKSWSLENSWINYKTSPAEFFRNARVHHMKCPI